MLMLWVAGTGRQVLSAQLHKSLREYRQADGKKVGPQCCGRDGSGGLDELGVPNSARKNGKRHQTAACAGFSGSKILTGVPVWLCSRPESFEFDVGRPLDCYVSIILLSDLDPFSD